MEIIWTTSYVELSTINKMYKYSSYENFQSNTAYINKLYVIG